MLNRQKQKYLRTRAITTPWQIHGTDRVNFKAAIIIPALAEADSLPKTLASLITNPAEYLSQALVLIVINNRLGATAEQKNENQRTLDWLQANPHPELNLAWIDAFSPGLELPAKEGVGLARKIGFDLALQHLDWQISPILISLDADTIVDQNYLPAIFSHFAVSSKCGATIPFRHQVGDTQDQEQAIRRYELYLRSYLFGLQQAGSPYAYHTIGSAFASRAAGYLAAGGMNRRQAAEDFYFLQQLAKTGGVEMLGGTVVSPSSRCSSRVPFGTGKVVQTQVAEQLARFQFCPAAAFAVLRDWLLLVEQNWAQNAEHLLLQVSELSTELLSFLSDLNFVEQWTKLQQNHVTKERLLRAFHGWFDGLRTRQLLGRWANEMLITEELVLVSELLAWGGSSSAENLEEQLQLLEQAQGVINPQLPA